MNLSPGQAHSFFEGMCKYKKETWPNVRKSNDELKAMWDANKLKVGYIKFRLFFLESRRRVRVTKQAKAQQGDGIRASDWELMKVGFLPQDVYKKRRLNKMLNRLQMNKVVQEIREFDEEHLIELDGIEKMVFESFVNERTERPEQSDLGESTVMFASHVFEGKRQRVFIDYCMNRLYQIMSGETADSLYKVCAVWLSYMYLVPKKLISMDAMLGLLIRILRRQPDMAVSLRFIATLISIVGPKLDAMPRRPLEPGQTTDNTKLSILYSFLFDNRNMESLETWDKCLVADQVVMRMNDWKVVQGQGQEIVAAPQKKPEVTHDWLDIFEGGWQNVDAGGKPVFFKKLGTASESDIKELLRQLFRRDEGSVSDFISFMCDATVWMVFKTDKFKDEQLDKFVGELATATLDQDNLEVSRTFMFIDTLARLAENSSMKRIIDVYKIYLMPFKRLAGLSSLFKEVLVGELTLEDGKQLCDLFEAIFDVSSEPNKEKLFRDLVWDTACLFEGGEDLQAKADQSVLYVLLIVWQSVQDCLQPSSDASAEETLVSSLKPVLDLRDKEILKRHDDKQGGMIEWLVGQSARSLSEDEELAVRLMAAIKQQ